ncbi:DUF2127 domain-containing protein [Pseudarthrobacter sp. NIBRBAC000502770]|nr:DUF2127 domain-containing protein [Pseudarthrobacter sp. NIBRBAC000502770]
MRSYPCPAAVPQRTRPTAHARRTLEPSTPPSHASRRLAGASGAGRCRLLCQGLSHLLHPGAVAAVQRRVLDLVRLGVQVRGGSVLERGQVSLEVRGELGEQLGVGDELVGHLLEPGARIARAERGPQFLPQAGHAGDGLLQRFGALLDLGTVAAGKGGGLDLVGVLHPVRRRGVLERGDVGLEGGGQLGEELRVVDQGFGCLRGTVPNSLGAVRVDAQERLQAAGAFRRFGLAGGGGGGGSCWTGGGGRGTHACNGHGTGGQEGCGSDADAGFHRRDRGFHHGVSFQFCACLPAGRRGPARDHYRSRCWGNAGCRGGPARGLLVGCRALSGGYTARVLRRECPMENTRQGTALLDRTFRISLILKGLDGVLELIGGVLLLLVTPAQINGLVRFLTQHELAQDPRDFVANALVHLTANLSGPASLFGAVYLLLHGVVKIVLVWAVLREKLWAYPWMIAFLLVFIAYQVYRISVEFTWGMVLLTAFDIFIVWITWREYRMRRAQNRVPVG